MFLLVLAVPAFLVVVTGYAIGHATWTWLGRLVDSAAGTSLAAGGEVAGWITGSLALVGAIRLAVIIRRSRERPGGPDR